MFGLGGMVARGGTGSENSSTYPSEEDVVVSQAS
jgi:hypothetical protein